MDKLQQTIVLVGLMGCGKSAIGIRLAKQTARPFVDIDKEIEKREAMTIAKIFQKHGEPYFRSCESKVLKELLEKGGYVIATGGGVFINDENRKLIKQKALSVWIRASYDVLLERVSRKKNRPLLEKGDKGTILRELMDQRYPIYEQADMVVDTTDAPHKVVVSKIIEKLGTGT